MMRSIELSLKIGGKVLLAGLDLHIAPGQCWCVIGPNGSGKTTLLRTLAGLRQPDGGSVQLDGRPLSDWTLEEQALRRAFLPAGRDDAFAYTALATVLAARYPHHGGRQWESVNDEAEAMGALERLGAVHLAQRDVRTLSGGQRQRVALAAMLAQQTPLLIMDEPTSAMDLAGRVGVMKLLGTLCREEGKSVVLVSHDLNLAYGAATHALLLMEGGGWEAGPVELVMTAPLLSDCLGHPIEIAMHGSRPVFVAREAVL